MPWWRGGVIYQILVPSFYDTTGDGLGDLPGITAKMEYLQWLGIDAVWLSPLYASPFLELGYDVTDYRDVNREFGTLNDFDAMIGEAHSRDIRVILDWVPNHTSSEHEWFRESRSSRENSRRDWYIWRDPKPDGSPPSNWLSIFGGSAWEFDDETGQYYLHTFLPEQPDLNWRNPDVRQAIYDAMRFWLDRGVDGLRIDALDLLLEDEELRDNPPNPDYDPERDGPDMVVLHEHTRNHPENHAIVAEMRRIVDEYEDRVLLGELYLGVDDLVRYYGTEHAEIHLPMNPTFASLTWNAEELHGSIEALLSKVPEGEWPCWMMSSHDSHRVATRAGWQQAGVAAMMLLTLRGTPIIYYGDEIGMQEVDIPPDRERDPQGKRIGRKRDPVRTPMQWDAQVYAGFSTSEPWLPVAENFHEITVSAQSQSRSLLELYRRLLDLRQEEPTLTAGTFEWCTVQDDVLSYRRDLEDARLIIVLNVGPDPRTMALADLGANDGAQVVVSTMLDKSGEIHDELELRGNEGVVLRPN